MGEQTVRLRVNRSGVGAEELRPLLEKVVAQVSPAMVEHPVVLPSECPAVDHPVIARVLGEVEYARGDAGWGCSYFSRKGSHLGAVGWTLSPEAMAQEAEIGADSVSAGRLRVIETDGASLHTRSNSETNWSDIVTIEELRQQMQVTLFDVESRSRPVGVSEADFEELMDLMIEAWRDAVG
ncbi:hypothetical protein [Nocardioides limicola]|uniref:hypothetical protein n=1 Tax=Nocardioides limicola TaxID=2803368 RepID=UPI00193C4EAE|nr:hypothetical protein [Nocardioides sp. DJM-14]